MAGPGFGLTYDPSHLPWLGIDPLDALEHARQAGLVGHVQAKDIQIDERAALDTGFSAGQPDAPRPPTSDGGATATLGPAASWLAQDYTVVTYDRPRPGRYGPAAIGTLIVHEPQLGQLLAGDDRAPFDLDLDSEPDAGAALDAIAVSVGFSRGRSGAGSPSQPSSPISHASVIPRQPADVTT